MASIGVTKVSDCPICLGTFKDPRVLPCGHTFCLICIKKHGRNIGSDPDPDCPICRAKFQIPSDGFEGLTKNYSLNSMLCENAIDVNVSKAKVTKGSCKKHHDEELVLYCVQCSMIICLDCMEEDHPKHDCCKISRFAKEARTKLQTYIESIPPILSQVTSQKTSIEEESKKFCDLLDETELEINMEYEKNKRLLDDHRRLLLEELSNEKQKVMKDLKMKTDEIEAEQLRLASFNTRIEELLQGSDEATTFDTVFQFKDFKDSFEQLNEMQAMVQYSRPTRSIKFIPGDCKDFIGGKANMIGSLQMESDSSPKIESDKKLASKLTTRSISSPIQTQRDDDISESQSSAADRFQPLNFTTPHGLTVHVSKGDLIHQSLDAIVSPANSDLSHRNGIAREIARAAGDVLAKESQDFIWRNRKLGIAQVMHTSAGNLRPKIKYVIHMFRPTRPDAKDDDWLFWLIKSAIFNCLQYANEKLKIHSIAIPAFRSGIFGVSIEVVVGRASFEALKMFDNLYASSNENNLREIHFINEDVSTSSNMKRIFQSSMKDFKRSSISPDQLVNVHHHFEALVKKSGSEDTVPVRVRKLREIGVKGAPVGTKRESSASNLTGKRPARADDEKPCIIC